ncbi:class I SAM-dependent methyltransferase, partial [Verrucomicrobiota bacterium]
MMGLFVRQSRFLVALIIGFTALVSLASQETAQDILGSTGVKGGLIVHLGCGDGELTAALRQSDAFIVQGLDSNKKNIPTARKNIANKGLYGPVSVEYFEGSTLPYAENMVNLIVVTSSYKLQVTSEELERVLAPRGVAMARKGSGLDFTGGDGAESKRPDPEEGLKGWTKLTKPVPPNIDDWSHYLHDAGNNAVAEDLVSGPPRRLKWASDPLWLRSHETPSGFQALVSAGGRVFHILDDGIIGIVDQRLPAKWSIVCQDAFNGKLLWKKPLPNWGWREWAKNSVAGKDLTRVPGLRGKLPKNNNWRLVADDDRVYVTLGYNAPLSILDAATGKLIKTVQETAGTQHIRTLDGKVVVFT